MAVQSENERNKAVVDEYFKAGVQGHLTSFAAYLHPDFTVTAPNYLPWGGRHVGAAFFRDHLLPSVTDVFDFARFSYDNVVAEDGHVAFLASDAARWITGASIPVDGGSKLYDLWNLLGKKESSMKTTEENNKKLVLEAFDTLFNKRDYAAAERYWSPDYIQHSNHIEPGREGLFNLIKSNPPTLKYEAGVIVAGGDFVMVHGRFSGFGAPVNWIAADIVRLQDGLLIEHWDVIQDEVTQEQSKSGLPMFGDKFPQ
jgi:predicted SnoaL-like aldol condensation-catalyzing enzyme